MAPKVITQADMLQVHVRVSVKGLLPNGITEEQLRIAMVRLLGEVRATVAESEILQEEGAVDLDLSWDGVLDMITPANAKPS